MCAKKEEYQGDCSQPIHNIHHNEYLFGGTTAGGGLIFPQLPCSLPPVHAFNPVQFSANPVWEHVHDPFLLPPPPSSYGGLLNTTRASASAAAIPYFAYDGAASANQLSSSLSDTFGGVGSASLGLQQSDHLGKMMSAQEIMDAKALAASKSHSEAERRRRERINNHFAKLRSLLPSTSKTDKASLLAEVIQHVKELKRQTCLIAETSFVPTEMDELSVDTSEVQDGKFVIKASLCCEDRSDLLADLIKTLKGLRLKTLKAEITTLGGRVKNVLFITGEEDSSCSSSGDDRVGSIQEALKAVMEKSCGDESSSGSVKRQRTNIRIIEHRSL